MAELRLENLSKLFPGRNRVPALQDLSLTINCGECVALLGPSGAGKSTVLRLIAGLEETTSGTVLLDGKDLTAIPAGNRELAMAFQFPALLPQLSVAQNLTLGPKLRRHSDRDARLAQIAEMLGLTRLLERMPETLSGGEQQRVALGRALLAKPRVLLLDEPLASLDPLARIELRDVIRRMQRELRLTTVYVTHDQAEAAAVADRIALLRDGALQQFATPQELYLNPANLFVARFFGLDGLNVMPVKVFQDGGWRAEAGHAIFRLSSAPKKSHNVLLAFRPAAVRLKEGKAVWQITERRDLGWTTVLRLASGENEITCHVPPNSEFAAGDSIELEIDPAHLYLFDRSREERLL